MMRVDEWEDLSELLTAIAQPWMKRAKCADEDPALFFPEHGHKSYAAVAICETCPVKKPCLDYALKTGQRHGVWGGAHERERRRLRREAAA